MLQQQAAKSTDIDLLTRWAHIEDIYGGDGARAYSQLRNALVAGKAPQTQIDEVTQRGLLVALRTAHLTEAKAFARALADAGYASGRELLETPADRESSAVELLGGADAFHFLLFGSGKSRPEEILQEYSYLLASTARSVDSHAAKTAWRDLSEKVNQYFRILSSLAAMGSRKGDHVEVVLSLKDKRDRQRTEKVLTLLGLKMKGNHGDLSLQSAEGKSQAKKQDALAALAVDEGAIQDSLAKGQSYTLQIPVDSVRVFPSLKLWQIAFRSRDNFEETRAQQAQSQALRPDSQRVPSVDGGAHPGLVRLAGGFFSLLLTDGRMPQLYFGINSMDRAVAETLISRMSLFALAERYATPMSYFSAALAMTGGHADVPGGDKASAVWTHLVGASPAEPLPFFQALMGRDEGRLFAFFYTLSQLDAAHQAFFTRSETRTKRFYDVFRESPDVRRYGHPMRFDTFTNFLHEIPLNADGTVDFPGDSGVWMVAKGYDSSATAVAKLTRKLKKTAAPDDEDQILIRLAGTEQNLQEAGSELANFIAVAHLDGERGNPLGRDSALLLAQGFRQYRHLYPYFAAIGDLEARDFEMAFSFEAKVNAMDVVTANMYLGEVHAFLALLGLARQSGLPGDGDVLKLYRQVLERFLKAEDGVARTAASLKGIDDVVHFAARKVQSHDEAMRLLLVGEAGSAEAMPRTKAYQEVLALQKVPSLDAIFSIWTRLEKKDFTVASLDDMQRQFATFEVFKARKEWKLSGNQKRHIESFQTAGAQSILAKLREKMAKKKRNEQELERLGAQLKTELEPWVHLAMVGQIYARFLDPTDALVSEDPLLLRKHEFIDLEPAGDRRKVFPPSTLAVSSQSAGSFFAGGLADFSVAAGNARAEGNHLGRAGSGGLAQALFASNGATDWRGVTQAKLRSFAAPVRLAREWIVESAASPAMYAELDKSATGLLSLTRRKRLLEAIESHAWAEVWDFVSVSDLHFLGDALLENVPAEKWNTDILRSLRRAALHKAEADELGSVALALNGSAQPRLRQYQPYEEYERQLSPIVLAQRSAELKLQLAQLTDDYALPIGLLPGAASRVADRLATKGIMRDSFDWMGALAAFRNLSVEDLELPATP